MFKKKRKKKGGQHRVLSTRTCGLDLLLVITIESVV